MLFKQFLLLSLDQLLLPICVLPNFGQFFLLSLFRLFVSFEFFLPQSFHLSLMFLLFNPSLLLHHLFNLVLFGKSFEHLSSKMGFHLLFLFLLSLFSIFGLLLSNLHLMFLSEFFHLFLFFLPAHLGFIFFLIKFSAQVINFLGFSPSLFLLQFQFLENLIFCLFFLLFNFLDNLSSVIKLFHVGNIFLILQLLQFFLLHSFLLFDLKLNYHVLKGLLFLSFPHGKLFHFTFNQSLHDFFHFIFLTQVLIICFLFLFNFFLHLLLEDLFSFPSLLLLHEFLLALSATLVLHFF